jgi:Glycine zipper 2TM domain
MKKLKESVGVTPKLALMAGVVGLTLAACESTDMGTGSPGIGTVAGAAAGAGAGRALFGSSPAGMLIGGAAGGLAGNMTLDRRAEARRQQEQEAARDAEMQRQLDFERQRALQAAEVERELEERRLFEQWQRERAAQG